jgi:HSP20 family protein
MNEIMNKKRPFKREEDFFDDWFGNSRAGWRFGFPSDVFDEFEGQFRKMQREMNYAFRNAMSEKLPSSKKGEPYVYGWSLHSVPDGKPHFEEFGNIPNTLRVSQQMLGAKGPIVDVIEGNKIVSITAEIPRVSKEDIELEIMEDTVVIKVDKEGKKYYKKVELPCDVDVDSAKASYRNGILDIELKKVKPKRTGKQIQIE